MKRLSVVTCAAVFAASLAGCDSGSSPSTGPFTLSVTDAPINAADIDRVCVDFNRITLHYAGQQDVVLDYDPQPSQVSEDTHCVSGVWDGMEPVPAVQLDALGGHLTAVLAESLQVPTGRVTWIRLHFAGNSYVVDNFGQHELQCPSCDVTDNNTGRGFKLHRSFEVTSAGIALTVDVDMLKSLLHENASGYILRPTARVELDESLSMIVGNVNEDVISGGGGTLYFGGDLDTGCAVYVYEGHDVMPDDYYGGSPVVSTARVRYDETSGLYSYAAGALPGGTESSPAPYTIALTCDEDDPLGDDDPSTDTDVFFTAGQNAELVTGQTEQKDFPLSPPSAQATL